MEKFNLEKLAQSYADGTMSPKECSLKLMEYVFLHKSLFGLRSLDEDDFLDFLLYEMPKFDRIFILYDKKIGTFFSFLQFTLRKAVNVWKKIEIRSKVLDDEITTSQKIQIEEDSETYELEAEGIEFIKQEDNSKIELSVQSPFQFDNDMTYRLDKYKEDDVKKNKIANIQKEIVLILALKSIFYIDDELIDKVCAYTGVDKETFLSMQKTLNAELKTKIKRRESCVKCRNNSYYFHRKYLQELQYLSPHTSWCRLIQEKYEKHTQSWINKNTRLKRKDYYVSASNRAVGKVLNLDPRHVKYILDKANNVDLFKPKQYHISHENISCNRQS
ncbi:MAG: hypothetical protein WCQ67_00045 [Treponema sp.]